MELKFCCITSFYFFLLKKTNKYQCHIYACKLALTSMGPFYTSIQALHITTKLSSRSETADVMWGKCKL